MKRIILVEDDEAIADVVRLILARAGYSVTIYENSTDLLTGNYEIPHLFMLDKQIPGVDGLELCRRLKNDPRVAAVPVIMLSASPQILVLAAAAGADAALEKPFSAADLRQLTSRFLG